MAKDVRLMRIEKALVVPAWGGYFNDDLAAIRAGAKKDGFTYTGEPVTPGFSQVRHQRRNGDSALTIALEFPWRRQKRIVAIRKLADHLAEAFR